jgi:hypothetical protein
VSAVINKKLEGNSDSKKASDLRKLNKLATCDPVSVGSKSSGVSLVITSKSKPRPLSNSFRLGEREARIIL